ncbi:MAG: hypothetical protein CM15mP81_08500 [Alphaproteobacteria bacterium]|nr:MAG: hypothetical protein CM15mP81_08500 [Alphaproteobacteria bacterium]
MEFKKIHLYGSDIEDYEVLSSLIQDAAIPTSEMKFDKVEKQFFLVCSRFSWESRLQNKGNKRIVSGICFDNVIEVKKKNFPSFNSENILNFLTLKKVTGFIELIFSNNILIKLVGNNISFRIDDLNKEWPTIFSPNHKN